MLSEAKHLKSFFAAPRLGNNWRSFASLRMTMFTWLIVAGAIVFALAPLFQRDLRGGFEMQKFGRLPVLLNGRIKPLDTVARTSLLIIHGRQSLGTEHGTLSAIDWLA